MSKQEELRQREAELFRREEALRDQERSLNAWAAEFPYSDDLGSYAKRPRLTHTRLPVHVVFLHLHFHFDAEVALPQTWGKQS